MSRWDRVICKACSHLMKLASSTTEARVMYALLRAQHRLIPADLERRADWPATWERIP